MFSVLENTSGFKSLFCRGALCENWVLCETASSMCYTCNEAPRFWWSVHQLSSPTTSFEQIYFYTNKNLICNLPITPDLSSADTRILLFKLLSYEYPICKLSAKLTSITTKARTNKISPSYCLRIPCCVRVHSCKQPYDVILEESVCNPHIARGWSFLGGQPIFI
jgi:hypothetical protein